MRVEKTEPYTIHPNEVVVLLIEEYGYRSWIWLPEMTETALEDWWHILPSVDLYFFDPSSLPGKMCIVQTERQYTQFRMLSESGRCYTGHIHEDDDSYLARPDNTSVFHQGRQTT